MGPESVPLVASRRSMLQGAALSLAGIMTGSGATFRRAAAGEAPRVEANGTGEASRPFKVLLENEGHAYHNWGLSHETRPAVYVEPISYADVQAVVGDPLRFPTPVSVVGALMSVTKTVVNDGGTLLCTLKLNEILGVETDAAGRSVVRVQAGCRLKKLHLWLQSRGLEIPYQAEIGDATVGSMAAGDTKDSSLEGPGYFSASVTALTYVDEQGTLVTLSDLVDEKALAEFKCSYGLSGIIVECLVEVRSARLCRSRFTVVTEESPQALGATIRRMHDECDALFVSVAMESLRALCDQRFSAGPGVKTPAASQPVFDQMLQYFVVNRSRANCRGTTNGDSASVGRLTSCADTLHRGSGGRDPPAQGAGQDLEAAASVSSAGGAAHAHRGGGAAEAGLRGA